MADIIEDMIVSPFSTRTGHEKMKIISKGKPRPVIKKHISFNSKNISIRELYDEEMWLTASKAIDTVVCWTCLLFAETDSDIKCYISKITDEKLYENILRHKASFFHITGACKYRLFIKQKLALNDMHTEEKLEQKISDVKNNGILQRIIKALCFLVANDSLPAKVVNDFYEVDTENCIQVLISSEVDVIPDVTEEAINIVRGYPQIITKIVKAIADIIKRNFEKEIKSCSHVSLILSEHSKNSKLSLVFRYVHKGNICERFIDIIDTRNINHIKRHILKMISHYKISSKLLSLSSDGGVLTTENVSDLLASLQKLFPFCILAPCHFHDINVVLEQRLSSLEGCELFFKFINSMKLLFQNNSRLCGDLKNFSKVTIPDLWDLKLSDVQFLILLKLFRCEFTAFISHIAENCEELRNNELETVMGLQYVLEQYKTVFLIEAFYLLFNRVAVLSDMLNSGSPEKVFDDNVLDSVEASLINEKSNRLEHLWTLVMNEIIRDSPELLKLIDKNETDALLELYSKAIDCMIEEINTRFKCVHKLEFLSIFDCEAHSKLLVSDYQVKQLQQIPGDFINKELLIVEMKMLSDIGWIFGGKSVFEFMEILTKMGLKDSFMNVYRLGEIILTLPCKPNTCTKCPSKFNIIESWDFNLDTPEMKALNLLFIEKDYLEQLQSQPDFHENVILKLQEHKREKRTLLKNIKSELREPEI